jgi:hypothetical protein
MITYDEAEFDGENLELRVKNATLRIPRPSRGLLRAVLRITTRVGGKHETNSGGRFKWRRRTQ